MGVHELFETVDPKYLDLYGKKAFYIEITTPATLHFVVEGVRDENAALEKVRRMIDNGDLPTRLSADARIDREAQLSAPVQYHIWESTVSDIAQELILRGDARTLEEARAIIAEAQIQENGETKDNDC